MQALDLIEILPELALLLVACLILLITPFMKEPEATQEDVFHAPRGASFAYALSLVSLLALAIVFGLDRKSVV